MVSRPGHATFVLVHGGRHGGWCWREVAARLRAAGHEVHTPTLTGVGERAHLARPDVDLDTHIRDLVATVEYEDLTEIVLVAHSYGGMVVTGAAEELHERIARLVYLDAFVPRGGESALDLTRPSIRATLLRMAEEEGDGWYVPKPTDLRFYGLPDDPSVGWVAKRVTGQPLATYAQALATAERAETIRRTFVRCTESSILPERFAAEARDDPRWEYLELACGHNAMMLAPDLTAELLLSLV